jgi:hypothetical protein
MPDRIRVKAGRDRDCARQRYVRASKTDLVDRILAGELTRIRLQLSWNRPSLAGRDRFSSNHF